MMMMVRVVVVVGAGHLLLPKNYKVVLPHSCDAPALLLVRSVLPTTEEEEEAAAAIIVAIYRSGRADHDNHRAYYRQQRVVVRRHHLRAAYYYRSCRASRAVVHDATRLLRTYVISSLVIAAAAL